MNGEYTVKMEIGGETVTFEDAEVKTVEEARDEAAELRRDAPDREDLTDGRTQDIDAVIEVLEQAKDRGVDTVKVNDDGQPRQARPRITNNHVEYHGLGPIPKTLFEWVEL